MTHAPNGKDFLARPDSDLDLLFVHSSWKAWYLTNVHGYSILRQTATPEPGWFGIVSYKRTWILKRQS